jgi:hypothetical protein
MPTGEVALKIHRHNHALGGRWRHSSPSIQEEEPMTTKRIFLGALAAIGLMAILAGPGRLGETGSATAASPPDTHVAQWDATATSAMLASPGFTPTEQIPLFGYFGIAMYDSVVAINGGYEPFLVEANAPAGASTEAAVAAAARGILLQHLTAPAAVAIIEAAYVNALAGIPDGPAEDDGVSVGAAVAQAVIAARAGDGYRAPQPDYVNADPPVPGAYITTPPPPSPIGPIGRHTAKMKPFVLDSADQFRPGGPPALHTGAWAKDYNEVKEIGSLNSTTRTAEQTLAARFWGENPVAQAHGAFRNFVLERELGIVDAARFMAMVTVTQADAAIACFDAKYHYAYWRPITAVRAGDTDGNATTVGDPGWQPLLPATPNHPEYPSAHSCLTPAAASVVSRFLGTGEIGYTVPSLTGLGDRYYPTAGDLIDEVGNARIWGGIHYRSAVRDGTNIGLKTANRVLARHFRPSD